jgi:hypothetical protein
MSDPASIEAPIPFAALIAWLRDHHFLLSDKQTCLRLVTFLFGCARQAGVPEERLQHVLHVTYHPRASKRNLDQASTARI